MPSRSAHIATRCLASIFLVAILPQQLIAESGPGPADRHLATTVAAARHGTPPSLDALRALCDAPAGAAIRDALLYELATLEKDTNPSAAVAVLSTILREFPKSPLIARAAALQIGLDRSAFERSTATALLARVAAGDAPHSDVAALALALGRLEENVDTVRAAALFMQSRQEGAGDAAAREAARRITKLRATRPQLMPASAEALYLEARLCAQERDVENQARWLDRLIAEHPGDSRFREAVIMRARMIASADGKTTAAEWLNAKARSATTNDNRIAFLFAAANQHWNADQDELALSGFASVLALKPAATLAQECRYATGRIHESHRRYRQAADAYQAAASGPKIELAAESRWRIGWAAYLEEDFATSRKSFASMISRYPSKEPRGARESALYWEARTVEHIDGKAAALPLYERVLESFPDGYYASLVETRTDLRAAKPGREPLPPDDQPRADTTSALVRIRGLDAIGFGDIAEIESHRLLSRSTDIEKRSALPGLTSAGSYGAALKAALGLYHRNVITEAQLNAFLYPQAYSEYVLEESAEKQLDAYLVYALIKQESLFNRFAVSPASAYGLMQLLLSTANRIAGRSGGTGLQIDDLYDPERNISLGTEYLAELTVRFGNNAVFVLAGYNAGEKAAESWRTRFGQLDSDELIERITYRETRDYVKKVLSNRRNYSRLYESR
jgi:soluble lytic murein transglycosylase-like protein/TolA-binding protein